MEIGGYNLEGWKSVAVSRSMESLSASFSFELTDKTGSASRAIQTGLEASLWMTDGIFRDRIVRGFIDSVSRSTSGTDNQMTVSGRDITGDLVDAAVLRKSSTWQAAKFSKIIKDICDPFSIEVDAVDLLSDPKIEKFTVQPGESAFQAIERLCRSQAVTPLTDKEGRLVLTYSGLTSTIDSLVLGKNVLSLTESVDWNDRFSRYIGKGQAGNGGKAWQKQNTQIAAEATDPEVTRYRPFLFLAESKTSLSMIRARVNWEAQVRAGRSKSYTATVRDWTQTGGIPWGINRRVSLRAASWGVDTELLITGLTFTLDDSGRRTDLTLNSVDTYRADPLERVELA